MAFDAKFLPLLRCPISGQELSLAEATLVDALNVRIAASELIDRSGRAVTQPLDGGLVRTDGELLFGVFDDIPNLLAEEAIPLPPAS